MLSVLIVAAISVAWPPDAPTVDVGRPTMDAAAALNESVAVEWGGRRAREAAAEILSACGLRLEIEAAAGGLLDGPVQSVPGAARRLELLHRIARQSGTEVAIHGKAVVFVRADGMPAVWAAAEHLRSGRAGTSGEDAIGIPEPSADMRTVDLALTDVPLAAFAAAVQARTGLAVRIDPELAGCQELVTIEPGPRPLREVLQAAERDLGVVTRVEGDVLFVAPRGRTPAAAEGRAAAGMAATATGTAIQVVDGASRSAGDDPMPAAAQRPWQLRSAELTVAAFASQAAARGIPIAVPERLRNVRLGRVIAEGPAADVAAAVLLAVGDGWPLLETQAAYELAPAAGATGETPSHRP